MDKSGTAIDGTVMTKLSDAMDATPLTQTVYYDWCWWWGVVESAEPGLRLWGPVAAAVGGGRSSAVRGPRGVQGFFCSDNGPNASGSTCY